MCGIAGFFRGSKTDFDYLKDSLYGMRVSLKHRGPDDSGVFFDAASGLGLAHTRLSIQDISSAGAQPMVSPEGRYVIVFNGELYNHLDIRAKLSKVNWVGHSDTETLLVAIEQWGLKAALDSFVGMFSFALWDKTALTITLARDRIGEKPLYYTKQNNLVAFSSELSVFKNNRFLNFEVDDSSLREYLRLGYVAAPKSIYKFTCKVPSGTYVTIKFSKSSNVSIDPPVKYWSLKGVFAKGAESPFLGSFESAVSDLDTMIRESVKIQMSSDVPLGAFLSGGIDSSTVVAMMSEFSSSRVKTYTVGFDEKEFDESGDARKIAEYFNTEHHELRLQMSSLPSMMRTVSGVYDEPFYDPSQLPTTLLSSYAAQQVSVSLTGDGGDEVFAGYRYYSRVLKMWKQINRMPYAVREVLAGILYKCPPRLISFIEVILSIFTDRFISDSLQQKLLTNLQRLTAANILELGITLRSRWHNPNDVLMVSHQGRLSNAQYSENTSLSFLQTLQCYDCESFLPDNMMVKVDRASMSVSLETRAPLLDCRIIQFAASLPDGYKLNSELGSKAILKAVSSRYIPGELRSLVKKGFGIPISSWLKHPQLRDWVEDLLSFERLSRDGFFNPSIVRTRLNEHLTEKNDWSNSLWAVIMFQQWYKVARSQLSGLKIKHN